MPHLARQILGDSMFKMAAVTTTKICEDFELQVKTTTNT